MKDNTAKLLGLEDVLVKNVYNGLADMVYVPGFGWIESQGPNHVEYAEDMYENGNKIGIMD